MMQLYRGEVSRANTWRTRLDATTNWAVISVGAALTFVFGAPQNPHFVLLLIFLLVLTFLFIEGRRYRYYALWSYRVHLIETDFFAAMLVPPFSPSPDWANYLAESLLQPSFPVTFWEAIGRRFHRNYVWLVSLLLISWGAKLAFHPVPATDGATVIKRASIGVIPGPWVMAAVGAIYGIMLVLAVAANIPVGWWKASPRLLPKVLRRIAGPRVTVPHTQERMTTIITAHGPAVAAQIMQELGRGITALQGTGMHDGEPRDVLLCAVTNVQIPHIKEIVHRVDPKAFVVVNTVKEVLGGGFRPFNIPS